MESVMSKPTTLQIPYLFVWIIHGDSLWSSTSSKLVARILNRSHLEQTFYRFSESPGPFQLYRGNVQLERGARDVNLRVGSERKGHRLCRIVTHRKTGDDRNPQWRKRTVQELQRSV